MSYPEAPDRLQRRSFLYDNALAILWYTWNGEDQIASGLARTLIALQNPTGSWGFSFDVERDGFYDSDFIRSGAIAWAAYGLQYFGSRTGDIQAADSARLAAEFLLSQRIRSAGVYEGLVGAGSGSHDANTGIFTIDRLMDMAVTEHQFDAHILFAHIFPDEADRLGDKIQHNLWLDEEGRFALAADADGLDHRRALDAAGAWGALWLWSIGETESARRSLRYTLEHFGVASEDRVGFRPYLDEIDGFIPEEAPGLIFLEGTLSVGLAAHRLGDEALATDILATALELSCLYGPGIPYASQDYVDFPRLAAAAPTLWYLFLKREMAISEQSPLFSVPKTR